MLSDYTFNLLLQVSRHPHGLPEDQFPDNVSIGDFKDLESRSLVSICTLIPPNVDPACMRGMSCVRLTSAGMDALFEEQRSKHKMVEQIAKENAQEEARSAERAQDKRRDFFYFVAGLVLGWLLGLITPADIIRWLQPVIHWIESLLH